MQVNVTLVIQLINALISIFVVKKWLAKPYLAYQTAQIQVLTSLAEKADTAKDKSALLTRKKQSALENFKQQNHRKLISLQKQLSNTLQKHHTALKQQQVCAIKLSETIEPDLNKIIEVIGDNS